jgi:drug/metabolite transporter (DMT)-like permease
VRAVAAQRRGYRQSPAPTRRILEPFPEPNGAAHPEKARGASAPSVFGTARTLRLLIPSGLAGLITTISPFWLVGVEALLPRGARLYLPTIGGMIVGLAGAGLLFTNDLGAGAIDQKMLEGFLLLQIGMASWSFGSIFQRRQSGKAHPIIAAGVQQLAAGLIALPLALGVPEHPIHWSARGVSALLYLVCFGSIVGYSAYAYALDRLPVAILSVYPYVNAIVAVGLGWLFYREPFGVREAVAMIVIFAGVAVVKRYASPRR